VKVRVTVLVEDSARRRGLVAEHGLSLLVDVEADDLSSCILLDTGSTPDTILKNADAMGVDLSRVDAIVISHGHYDHTGGLVGVLKRIGRRIPVVAHPKAFDLKLAYRPVLRYMGGPTMREVEEAGGVLVLAKGPVKLAEGVVTTGEVERSTSFEGVEEFWTVADGIFVRDEMPDDQSLVIKGDEGVIVLTGCAHSGVVNTVIHAKSLMGVDRVKAVIGGFHLIGASEGRIRRTVEELRRLNPDLLAPCHCTGLKAVNAFMEAFGEKCRPPSTGDVIEI